MFRGVRGGSEDAIMIKKERQPEERRGGEGREGRGGEGRGGEERLLDVVVFHRFNSLLQTPTYFSIGAISCLVERLKRSTGLLFTKRLEDLWRRGMRAE